MNLAFQWGERKKIDFLLLLGGDFVLSGICIEHT